MVREIAAKKYDSYLLILLFIFPPAQHENMSGQTGHRLGIRQNKPHRG